MTVPLFSELIQFPIAAVAPGLIKKNIYFFILDS